MVESNDMKQSLIKRVSRNKLFTTVLVVFLYLLIGYVFVFSVQKPVFLLSATETVCVNQLTLYPGKHQVTTGTAAFTVTFEESIEVGSKTIAATAICFTPTFSLAAGEYEVGVAPYGGLFAQKIFTVTVI